MLITQKIKVWLFKFWRFVKFGFSKTRHRSVNTFFMLPVKADCDYCHDGEMSCVVIECDFEVYAKVCERCLTRMQAVFPKPELFVQEQV